MSWPSDREPPPPGTADLCRWLARAAAHDTGLVKRLVRVYGSFDTVVRQPRERLVAQVRTREQSGGSSDSGFEFDTESCSAGGLDERVVTWADDDYPSQLRDLYDPPPALYVRGARQAELLGALAARPAVAVVGARRPSPYGLEMATLLGSGLVRAGVNVVSGVALGIDAAAQVDAVRVVAGRGRQDGDHELAPSSLRGVVPPVAIVGVLGSGVRVVAPRTNTRLFEAIYANGLLLGEYGWDTPPAPWRFPARNRVIAGLARAVVIVEGRPTSGALHTATFALDLGRDVLAVPGEAGRPLAAAPHRLLRDGAHLCESVDDVLALLPDGPWREHGTGAGIAGACGSQAAAGGGGSPEGRGGGPRGGGPTTRPTS